MTLNTWDTAVPTYTFGMIWWFQTDMWPVVPRCQINDKSSHFTTPAVGINAYLKKNRSRFLKVCGLQTTVKNQIMAWRKLELHFSYVSESTITLSPGYDWGMKGIELHCSYTSQIKTRKATKLHERHTIEVRKENLDHKRIINWFTPGNLCWKGDGEWLL